MLGTSIGLLLTSCAYALARQDSGWSVPLFWIGILTTLLPFAGRLLSASAPRRERVGLVCMLGVALYLVKLFHSPTEFVMHDELLHWKTANDILRTGRLFHVNSLLPVSPLYPGLESITTAFVRLSGLSIFQAGAIVVGSARVVLMLALYFFFERVSGSPRLAGISTLVYALNPNFVFFDAQFAYESVALSLAILAFLTAQRWLDGGSVAGSVLSAALAMGAVVVTHHVTTYILLTFFLVWSLSALVVQRDCGTAAGIGGAAVIAALAATGWLVYVASPTVDYLAPHVQGGVNDIIALITREGGQRELFQSYGGPQSPLWERVLILASIAATVLALPLGLWRIWRRARRNAIVLTLGAGATAWPVLLLLRLTENGAELASRAAGFLFVGVGFVIGLGVAALLERRERSWWMTAAFLCWVSVVFVGGIIANVGSTSYFLPGPYLVGADARSIEPQSVTAAEWAGEALGPDHRIVSDRTNRLLFGAYGEQDPITSLADDISLSWVFFSPRLGIEERAALAAADVAYVVVDQRLSTALPRVGIYFEPGEPDAFEHTVPIPIEALRKFDGVPGISLIYDSSDIKVYDLREWLRGA